MICLCILFVIWPWRCSNIRGGGSKIDHPGPYKRIASQQPWSSTVGYSHNLFLPNRHERRQPLLKPEVPTTRHSDFLLGTNQGASKRRRGCSTRSVPFVYSGDAHSQIPPICSEITQEQLPRTLQRQCFPRLTSQLMTIPTPAPTLRCRTCYQRNGPTQIAARTPAMSRWT